MLSDLLISLERGVAPLIALIFLGFLWRIKTPAGLSVMDTRRTINALVLYLFYPGLAFDVISRAHFGLEVIWVPLSVWVSLLAALGVGWLVFARYRTALGAHSAGARCFADCRLFWQYPLEWALPCCSRCFGPDAARYAYLR